MCFGTSEKNWEVESFFFSLPKATKAFKSHGGSGARSTKGAKGAFLGRKEKFEPQGETEKLRWDEVLRVFRIKSVIEIIIITMIFFLF